MRNTTILLVFFSLLLGGCYRVGALAEKSDGDAGTDDGVDSDEGTDTGDEPDDPPDPGELAWAVSMGDYEFETPHILDIDGEGNIRVLAGLSIYHQDDGSSEPLGNFILTFDSDGGFVEKTPVPDIDFTVGKVARLGDSFVLAGWMRMSSPIYFNASLARISSDGSLEWKTAAGEGSSSRINDVAIDEDGNIWTTGSFWEIWSEDGPFSFDLGDSSQSLELAAGTSESTFIAAHDANGQLLRLSRPVSGVSSYGISIAVASDGSVYAGGAYGTGESDVLDLVTFGEGQSAVTYAVSDDGDGYLAKLSGEGDLEWVSRVISSSSRAIPYLAAAPDGHVRVAGVVRPAQTVAFKHPIYADVVLGTVGIFLADVSAEGVVTPIDSPHGEYSSTITAFQVTSDGAFLVAGSFLYDYPIFDPSLDSWAANPASGGTQDVYYAHNTFTAVYGPEMDFEWVSFGTTEWNKNRTYSIIAEGDGAVYSTGVWNGICYDAGFGWGYTDITFALDETNETTLPHEDRHYNGFLTKSYR